MEKKIDEVRNLKVGRYIIIDDIPCKITAMTKSKPGKHGGAKAKIDGTGIFNKQKKSLMKPTSAKVEVPVINKYNGQVLTLVGDGVQVMNMDTYETIDMPMPDEDEIKGKIAEGVEILYMEVMGKTKIIQIKE